MNDPSQGSRRARRAEPVPERPVALPPGVPAIRCLFQPIVELSTERTVGFEALTRGVDDRSAAGNSDALFEWAHRTGRLRELDWASRMTAMRSALALRFAPGCGLFINIEPAALGGRVPPDFPPLVEAIRESGMAVVVEFTERELTDNVAGLLRLGDWVREQGWSVAIDDVGADPDSLALLPLLKPEIIKLDLRLIQSRTTVDVAQIVNAVNAEAGRTGALVLAEGIETEHHAALAVSMGAHLGQGWFYGRPASDPQVATEPLRVSHQRSVHPEPRPDTPWELVAHLPGVRRADKVLVDAMSRHLERQAMASTDPVVVVGSLQNVLQYRASTARRFAALAAAGAIVVVLGRGVEDEPSAGVQGQHISSHDPIGREWTIAVITAHFAGALISTDCGDEGVDSARRFDYVVTYDRDIVLAAADIMLRRLVPHAVADDVADPEDAADPEHPADPENIAAPGRPASIVRGEQPEAIGQDRRLPLLAKALAASSNSITISDATAPDLPLVYANAGFEAMTGYSAAEVLGRNCRFLQGPQTEGRRIDELRRMLAAGEGGQVTLLNYRRDGTPFWNRLMLSPIADTAGRLTHFLAISSDVSDLFSPNAAAGDVDQAPIGQAPVKKIIVKGARPLARQPGTSAPAPTIAAAPPSEPPPAKAAAVSTGFSQPALSGTPAAALDLMADPVTGLMDRGAAQLRLQALLNATGPRPALLVASLQRPDYEPGSGPSMDAAGLARVAQALIEAASEAMVFRNGDTEFGLLTRLSGRNSVVEAYALAGRLHQAVMELGGGTDAELVLSLSIGIALWPDDGDNVEQLWRAAEAALVYAEDSGPHGTRYATDVPVQHRATPARAQPANAPLHEPVSRTPSW
jgi:PAS domain S-box-containing protein